MQKQSKFSILLEIVLGLLFLSALSFWFAGSFWRQVQAQIKSEGGRVNVLILGKGGVGHSGPDLTDTMILASVSLEKNSIVLISIPRDIWIPEIRAKINSAFYWGGFDLAKASVEKALGVPVNYVFVMDFSSFKEIVDALGGIKVEVERSFVDSQYPLAGKENDLCSGDKTFQCRYETLHFARGEQFMDGETALKFVRSRNGDNGENTDFAREARQQKVINAIKNKILTRQTFLNPKKYLALIDIFKSSVETDLGRSAAAVLAKILVFDQARISSFILPEDLLTSPAKSSKYDNQYVLIPRPGTWDEIHEWINTILH